MTRIVEGLQEKMITKALLQFPLRYIDMLTLRMTLLTTLILVDIVGELVLSETMFVHEYIGAEFVLQKSNFQTGQGRRYDSAFRRYTVNKVLAELGRNTRGVNGNSLRPDLVDFDERVLYEIKPQGYEKEGREDLNKYLKLINIQLEPGDRRWREGTAREYVPSRRIVAPPAKVIRIDPPQNGLILYEQENDYTNNFLVTVEILAITAALLYALKDALGRRTAVFGF